MGGPILGPIDDLGFSKFQFKVPRGCFFLDVNCDRQLLTSLVGYIFWLCERIGNPVYCDSKKLYAGVNGLWNDDGAERSIFLGPHDNTVQLRFTKGCRCAGREVQRCFSSRIG